MRRVISNKHVHTYIRVSFVHTMRRDYGGKFKKKKKSFQDHYAGQLRNIRCSINGLFGSGMRARMRRRYCATWNNPA